MLLTQNNNYLKDARLLLQLELKAVFLLSRTVVPASFKLLPGRFASTLVNTGRAVAAAVETGLLLPALALADSAKYKFDLL
jgi:hypothetical protein